MNRYQRYWIVSLATLMAVGVALLIVGVTATTAKAYAITGLVVVVVGWAPLVLAAVGEPPTVPPSDDGAPSSNGQAPAKERTRT